MKITKLTVKRKYPTKEGTRTIYSIILGTDKDIKELGFSPEDEIMIIKIAKGVVMLVKEK